MGLDASGAFHSVIEATQGGQARVIDALGRA